MWHLMGWLPAQPRGVAPRLEARSFRASSFLGDATVFCAIHGVNIPAIHEKRLRSSLRKFHVLPKKWAQATWPRHVAPRSCVSFYCHFEDMFEWLRSDSWCRAPLGLSAPGNFSTPTLLGNCPLMLPVQAQPMPFPSTRKVRAPPPAPVPRWKKRRVISTSAVRFSVERIRVTAACDSVGHPHSHRSQPLEAWNIEAWNIQGMTAGQCVFL